MDVEIDIDVEWGRVRVIPVPATAADVVVIKGPCKLCGWSLRESSGGGYPGTAIEGKGAYAAAGAGNAALPAGNTFLTGFDVTMAAPAAGVTGLVTVTNVLNGPLTYDFSAGPSRENILSVDIPDGLPSAGGAPTVAINAIVGGGAGNINVYGQFASAAAAAEIRDGGQMLGKTAMAPGLSDTQFFGKDGIAVMNEIAIHMLAGTIEGVIYARYQA